MKRALKHGLKWILAATALASLGACAVVPAGPGYYGGPAVVVPPPPVVFRPWGGYYGRGWGGGYRHRW